MGIENQTNTRVFSDSTFRQEISTKNAVQEFHLRTQPHQIPTEWRGHAGERQEASVIVGRLFVGIWQVSCRDLWCSWGEGRWGLDWLMLASLPIAFCATDYIVSLFFFGRLFSCVKKHLQHTFVLRPSGHVENISFLSFL
jgi:hypothetical protein